MPKKPETRARIIDVATQILLSENVSSLSIDNICGRVGITKKAFYYHFESKDQLLEAVMSERQPRYTAKFKGWAAEAGENAPMHDRMQALFRAMAREGSRPEWKGCCCLRVAAELGNLPGHPARKLAAEANQSLAAWLAEDLEREGHPNPAETASHLLMLINGLIITMVVHRDTKYVDFALSTAERLVPAPSNHKVQIAA